MIKTFRSKPLADLWSTSKTSKIDIRLQKRIRARLDQLDAASQPEDMDLPGFDFHMLHGKPHRYTVHVNGPWCIMFEFQDGDAYRVDLELVSLGSRNMTEYTANRNRCPTHPGAVLADTVIPATGLPKAEIARMLGISRQHLYDILAERKPVTANVAVRLGKLFGNGPDTWIRMQAAYDVWQAAHEVDLDAIPTVRAA